MWRDRWRSRSKYENASINKWWLSDCELKKDAKHPGVAQA